MKEEWGRGIMGWPPLEGVAFLSNKKG